MTPATTHQQKLLIGARVLHRLTGEYGTIEEFRADGQPIVRWDYGNLLRCRPDNLEEVKP